MSQSHPICSRARLVFGRRNRLITTLLTGVAALFSSALLAAAAISPPAADSQMQLPAAQPSIKLSQIDTYTRLLPTIMVYHDHSKQLTATAAEQLWQQGQFTAPRRDRAGVGLIDHPLWGRFVLHNDKAQAANVVLEYIDHSLAHINLYSSAGGELTDHGHISYFAPYGTRPVEHSRYAYNVTLAPGEQRVFYVRMAVQSAGPVFADMRVWQPKVFAIAQSRELFFSGFFSGYLGLILIASLIGCVTLRSYALLFYASYVLSHIYGWGSITGFLPEILFRDGYHWRHMVIGGALNISFAALFTRSLLNTAATLPRLDKCILALALFGLIPIISALCSISLFAVLGIEIQLLCMGVLILAGILRAKQGEMLGLFFSLSWALYITGMTLYPLRELGMIDHLPITYWVSPVGALIEVSLLLAIISLWLKRTQQAKIQARRQYLEGLVHQKTHLEQEVQLRTAELQIAKEHAELEARTDSLTGLPNRRHLFERLELELSRSQRHQLPLCLMLIDLDHFKHINDAHGHSVGDMALQHVAREIAVHIRSYDLLARLGGEEFALLMTETDLDEALLFAERVRQHVATTPLRLEAGDKKQESEQQDAITITLTGGVVKAFDLDTASTLFSRADNLLYQGKAEGRNRIVVQQLRRVSLGVSEPRD